MKTWIIELPDNEIPQKKYCEVCDYKGTRNCAPSCSDWHMHTAKEAMPISIPMGLELSAVLDKQGFKTDWRKVVLYAVEGLPTQGAK